MDNEPIRRAIALQLLHDLNNALCGLISWIGVASDECSCARLSCPAASRLICDEDDLFDTACSLRSMFDDLRHNRISVNNTSPRSSLRADAIETCLRQSQDYHEGCSSIRSSFLSSLRHSMALLESYYDFCDTPLEDTSIIPSRLLAPHCDIYASVAGTRLSVRRLLCSDAQIQCSGMALLRIVDNLFFNALRSVQRRLAHSMDSSQSCEVVIWVREERCGDTDSVVLEVRDTGVGMSRDEIQHVLENSKGFGLASVQRLTRHYGGTFSLESQPGIGTVASLRFPALDTHT